MRQEIDKIEIKEPPIEELNKKRSCLKRTCVTGCGCLTIIFIISLIALKLSLGPRSKELRDLPPEFTKHVPLYDEENIEKIVYISGKERGRVIETAAYLPKVIIAPAVIHSDKVRNFLGINFSTSTTNDWDKFFEFVGRPIVDHRDQIQIEWTLMPASKEFIQEYYETEFEKESFYIELESFNDETKQIVFSKDDIKGVLSILDKPGTPETDLVTMNVYTTLSTTP